MKLGHNTVGGKTIQQVTDLIVPNVVHSILDTIEVNMANCI